MNVKELIDRLKTLPEDAPVFVRANDPDIACGLVVDIADIGIAESEILGAAVVLETEEL
jgi:hypothetical protein